MNNRKSFAASIFFFFFLVTLYIARKSNSLTLLSGPIQYIQGTYVPPNTCLNSYDSRMFQQSGFEMAMVTFKVPSSLGNWTQNKIGFEVGGPSMSTWGSLGVYDASKTLDITNFASNTLWHSGISHGAPFMWKNKTKGKHYLHDAVDLNGIRSEIYDFVCASDVLEHIANPFKALLEWIRVLKHGGYLMIIVPFKNVTFDHKREVNRMEHLINDYHNQTTEADLSHLDDIVRLHDIGRDWAAGNIEAFRKRSEKNFQHRGLHQHVYDQQLLYVIYKCLDLEVKTQFTWDYHNLIIGQKR